jgi:hypothetical protein
MRPVIDRPIAAKARLLQGWGAFVGNQAALVPGRR